MASPFGFEEVRGVDAGTSVLRLQGAAGNAAVSALLRRRSPGGTVVQRDLDDQAALTAVDTLPAEVLSGNGAVPLATDGQKRDFLRAGREWFGTYEATLEHFRQIETCGVPGHPRLHSAAKARLEAAAGTLTSPIPSSTIAFSFRRQFTSDTRYTSASMHTLGYAMDYDALNMPRIGRGETAELLRLTTGGPSNAQLGEYSARRSLIQSTGRATSDGGALPAHSQQLFDQIRSESQRLSTASQAFQSSLGSARDQFLDARTRYFEAATPQAKAIVLAEIPALIQPWTDAVSAEEGRTRTAATAASLDPAALPGRAVLSGRISRLQNSSRAASVALRSSGAKEPPATSRTMRRVGQAETELGLTSDGTFAERVARLAERTEQTVELLRPLVGASERLTLLASLRNKLSQPGFLFGTEQKGVRGARSSTKAVVDTPSMSQLLERGFYNPGTPEAGRQRFNADFMVAMAQHGFDLGMAWAGESTDSMHMELVAPRGT